jgi:predicted Holliday junction resolvase-like endonuclease
MTGAVIIIIIVLAAIIAVLIYGISRMKQAETEAMAEIDRANKQADIAMREVGIREQLQAKTEEINREKNQALDNLDSVDASVDVLRDIAAKRAGRRVPKSTDAGN